MESALLKQSLVSTFEASIHSMDEFLSLHYVFVETPDKEISTADFPFVLFDHPYLSEAAQIFRKGAQFEEEKVESILRSLFNTILAGRPFPPTAPSSREPRGFLDYLSSEARFPITQSPLEGKTLKEICKEVSPMAVSFLLVNQSPYAVFEVAGGIVLLGLALGLAEGLRQGVKERLILMIAKKRRERRKSLSAHQE